MFISAIITNTGDKSTDINSNETQIKLHESFQTENKNLPVFSNN